MEAVINQRPLTVVTEDADDLIPLTPAMFLQGIPNSSVPDVDEVEQKGFQKRFQYRQQVLEELRMRFRKEYLGLLVQKSKEAKPSNRLVVGDIVFIGHENKKRLDWPMGKIVELIPGKGGDIRLAKVKTSSGVLTRPLQRLYPCEVKNGDPLEDIIKENPEKTTKSGRTSRKPVRFGDL